MDIPEEEASEDDDDEEEAPPVAQQQNVDVPVKLITASSFFPKLRNPKKKQPDPSAQNMGKFKGFMGAKQEEPVPNRGLRSSSHNRSKSAQQLAVGINTALTM